MYQAAVSKTEGASCSSAVMEESEACSLPGGLASVKRQFESKDMSSSQSTVTQFYFKNRSVQDTSDVTARSSARELFPSSQQVTFFQDEKVSHDQSVHQSSVASSYENHYDEMVRLSGDEDSPKISTQALKEQFERSIEEATPTKQIKIELDYNQIQWDPVVSVSSRASAGKMYETSTLTRRVGGNAATSAYGSMEHFPPPPPDLLQVSSDVPDRCCSPELPEPTCTPKYVVNKEQYSKQRNLYELKRLYKHINPEVRKNLERDFFSDVTEIEGNQLESQEEIGDVQQARYVFENTGNSPNKSMSPEREYLEWDEILKGEVQSMRWMFENKPLDLIKDESPDEDNVKNIAQQEIIAGSDVKYTAWMFETQPMDALGSDTPDSIKKTRRFPELARGDVRTATWLFETQPMDALNKIHQEEEQTAELIYTHEVTGGDVKTTRYLLETQHLDSLGHTETIDENHFLNLKSELEEMKGDVKMTTKMFETQPMCVIRGDSGQMLEITTVRREETEKGDVKTSRWLFETQPLDMINKDPSQVKVICSVSMEDNVKGGVNLGRWLFETKTLDSIKDEDWQSSKQEKEEIIGADVRKHCWAFETQPMDTLKDNSNARPVPTEEIIGGDVRSARHLFETVPMAALKDSPEVGKLQKVVASEEEKGDVRHQRWVFESQPLEHIRDEKKEFIRTVNLEELDKGDVTNYKERFETMDLSRCDATQKIQVEGVTSGSVKSNKVLFESTPMYAMQDSSGHYHEVKTVRREEIVEGDVRRCKWMFETQPIDQFDESIKHFQIIKGISKQEIESGDVKTAKWLFETQPLDSIKYFSNVEDEEGVTKENDIVSGDVKTCRWLFETQQMDALYEKEEVNKAETEEIYKGDVKTCTWLFETQNLDTLKDESETVLKTRTVEQEDVQGKDVRMARFLFETENLENITGEESSTVKRVTEIDIQSGDVSRMKYIFENQSSDIVTSTSEEIMLKLKASQKEDIQKGNVVNCKWMFENQPIDTIREITEEPRDTRTVTDVQGGNVDKGRFIFETISLDKIQEESSEAEMTQIQKIIREDIEKGDVKNYTMMFETQPLYAIRDKEGHYHEVTTVTKEETMRGDVVGARWLFETKPLDSIKDTDEVYVIKAVTEEDIQKGDVTSARWRFETQPLDEITEDMKVSVKTVADIQGGDVKMNKKRFERDEMSQKYVRTVSVSEIQKGDVRTATWMFETHTIDNIRGEGSEYEEMEKVTKEEVLKGDVKQSVWLFEKQPLDSIRESDETDVVVTREEIPQADVKTTTWLFETTPFHEFNESSVEKREIMGKSIKDTLEELYSQKMVNSQGILIEADEIGDVRMAKYKLMNQEAPQIQREEILRGDLSNIMMNLLNKQEKTERGITIDEEERGNINTTVKQLFSQEMGLNVQKEEIIRGDIQEAIHKLLKKEGSNKRGILIEEDEKGDVRMTIYSLLNKREENGLDKEDVVRGDVKQALHRLLSNSGSTEQSMKIKVSETERGNVSFYSTCIESGALDYLKQLQTEPDDTLLGKEDKERIVGGDVEGTKRMLSSSQAQIERTVTADDIVPGDVNNTVKVFMMEPVMSSDNMQKEEIVKGDLRAALNSLTQAINQAVVVEKEEVVKGDIPMALRSLKKAQHQSKEVEKPDIVPGDIKGALESLEKSATSRAEIIIEDLVPGDIKGTLKSLEQAKKAVREVEKEEIVRGDIHTAMQSLRQASNEKKVFQQEEMVQGDVRGTIQLLLEPPAPSRMQRRPSTEGDVKNSIKSLYDMPEQAQMEKEEVIKGDVKGTIKSLLQETQQSRAKIRIDNSRKVRVPVKTPLLSQQETHASSVMTRDECETVNSVPAVKNLSQSAESQSSAQKHTNIKSVKSKPLTQEDHSFTTQTAVINKSHTSLQTNVNEQSVKQKAAASTIIKKKNVTSQMTESQTSVTAEHTQSVKTVRQVQTVAEHKTVTEKQNIKFRNLETGRKGLITSDKKKQKSEITNLPPPPPSPPPMSEPELPLPPPPPPIAESDNATSRPPVMRQDSDLPPPPPPPIESITSEPEHFPPPPPPPPPPAPGQDYLPPPPSEQELQPVPSQPSKKIPSGVPLPKPKQEECPRPPRKVFIPPIKVPPPPEEHTPVKKPYVRKFKTPLMIAEERYRKQKEESEKNKGGITPIHPPDKEEAQVSLSVVSEKSATENIAKEQSETSIASEITQSITEELVTKFKPAVSHSSPAHTESKDIPTSKPLTSTVNQKTAVLSSAKQQTTSSHTSVSSSVKQQTTSISSVRHQTVSSSEQKVTSVSSSQSHSTSDVQSSASVALAAASDHLESILQISSEDDIPKKDIIQEFVNLKSEASPNTDKSKENDSSVAQALEKVPPPPSSSNKIPKVTPSFKVKPQTAPKVEKTGKQEENKDVKTEIKGADTSAEQLSQKREESTLQVHSVKAVQEITQTVTTVQEQTTTEVKGETLEEHKQKEKTATTKDSKTENQTKKSKRKSKKEKEAKQQTLVKAAKETKPPGSVKAAPEQEEISTVQTHKAIKEERVQVTEEVVITESKVQQSFQQESTGQLQKQTKSSKKQKEQTTSKQRVQDKSSEDSEDAPATLTGNQAEKEAAAPLKAGAEATQKRDEVKKLLSQIKKLQGASGKISSESVKRLLGNVPEWLIGPEEKNDLEAVAVEHNIQRLKEIIVYVRNLAQAKLLYLDENMASLEKHESEPVSEKKVTSGATPKTSKLSAGSAKPETEKGTGEAKKASRKKKKQDSSGGKTDDLRDSSPLIGLSSPSPAVITNESMRTDSPLQSDTPTPEIKEDTTSSTSNQPDDPAKLSTTLAESSHRDSPPLTPQPLEVTKICEPVESPQLFREDKDESEVAVVSGSVRHKKEFFEEAQKAEVNKTYVRKDPIDIPERLGPDTEEPEIENPEKEFVEPPWVDLLGLVHKFESPSHMSVVNATHVRKDPIEIPERLSADIEETENKNTEKEHEELPKVDLLGLVHKFESPAQMSDENRQKDPLDITGHFGMEREETEKHPEKEQEELPRVDLLELVHKFETPSEMTDVSRRKDPIDIPERLGPDMEETENVLPEKEHEELPKVDLLGLLNKFESPEQKVYVRKEPISIPERLGSDTEDTEAEEDKKTTQMEEILSLDIKAIKTVFEADQNVHVKQQKIRQEKLDSEVSEIMTGDSRETNTSRQERDSWQSSPLPDQKDPFGPVGFSETKSTMEQFSSVDEFGNKLSGTRSTANVSHHSESPTPQRSPLSYADVVRRKTSGLDESASVSHSEFQKVCTESESTFTSLTYSVCQESTSQTVSHKEETVMTENSSSRIRAVQGMSEEGLSDGVFDCGQTKLP
ncbi:xin actin-binding repeat-containing protein 2-like [Megalops cyprinoides]|uniref:xin actin-binding repeat-containing protein 2-like n=1 Tax=Megalops cyprinoides TaxID=118141 RepID=UPI00186446A1|nr:xin actin-binding repeat-containing protein 2-like [Megalops cyprinoides]